MIFNFSSLRSGLIAAWCPSLTGVSNRIYNSSASNIPATIPSPWSGSSAVQRGRRCLYVPGALGGISRYTTANLPNAYLSRSFTYSLWVLRIGAVTQNWPGVVSHGRNTNILNGANIGLAASNAGAIANRLYVEHSNGTSTGAAAVYESTASNDGRWHHIAMVVDRAQQLMFLYKDGLLDGSTSVANVTGTISPLYGLLFGIRPDSLGINSQNNAVLWLDDVRVYSRALLGAEIAALATGPGVGLIGTRQRRTPARKMWVRVGGVWRNADTYHNVGGTWKLAVPYAKDGDWK
jgi:hypothetical protein